MEVKTKSLLVLFLIPALGQPSSSPPRPSCAPPPPCGAFPSLRCASSPPARVGVARAPAASSSHAHAVVAAKCREKEVHVQHLR